MASDDGDDRQHGVDQRPRQRRHEPDHPGHDEAGQRHGPAATAGHAEHAGDEDGA